MDTRTTKDVKQVYYKLGTQDRLTYPMGWSKTITSVREGHLVPGTWRYNPVTIFSARASCEPQDFGSNGFAPYVACWMKAVGFDNGYWWYTTPQGSIPASLVASARIKAANRRLDPQFAGLVFFAELKETLGMLFSPIRLGRRLLQRGITKSLKYRSPQKRRAYLSDWWLQARYGWIPLASDISSGCDTIMLGVERNRTKFYTTYGSAKLSIRRNLNWTRTDCLQYFGNLVGVKYEETFDYSVRSTHGWEYRLGHETDQWLSQIGVHYRDIPGVIWELVPFSFAIDWFLNVGDFIKYLRPTPWVQKVGEGYSAKIQWERKIDPTGISRLSGWGGWCTGPVLGYPNPFIWSQLSYTRNQPVELVMLPVLDTRFRSWKHMVDSLSLSIQKLKR